MIADALNLLLGAIVTIGIPAAAIAYIAVTIADRRQLP